MLAELLGSGEGGGMRAEGTASGGASRANPVLPGCVCGCRALLLPTQAVGTGQCDQTIA